MTSNTPSDPRQARLAQALRANLRRRKAPTDGASQASPDVGVESDDPDRDGAGPDERLYRG